MIFHIGPWVYTVKIARNLKNEKGEPLMGRALMDKMEILIDADIAPAARQHVLLHELRHLWGFHFPAPSSEEEECDLSATIQASTMADMRANGGVEALMGLMPSPACDHVQAGDAGIRLDGLPTP